MNTEMIDKMKKNEKPFVLLSKEIQEATRAIPARYFDCLTIKSAVDNPIWNQCEDGNRDFEDGENMISTFRLHSDYQPEPEITECEVSPLYGTRCPTCGYEICICGDKDKTIADQKKAIEDLIMALERIEAQERDLLIISGDITEGVSLHTASKALEAARKARKARK